MPGHFQADFGCHLAECCFGTSSIHAWVARHRVPRKYFAPLPLRFGHRTPYPSSDLIFPAARNLSSLVSVGPNPRVLMNLWKGNPWRSNKNATEVGNYLVWVAALHNKFLKKLPKDILIDGVPSSLTQPDIGDFQFSMCMATRMARFCLTGKVGRRARKLALMSWTATPTTLATRNAKKKKTQGLISPVLAGFPH